MTTDNRDAEYVRGRLYAIESLLFALYDSLLFKNMSTEEKEIFLELIDEMTKEDHNKTFLSERSYDFSRGVVQGYHSWKKRTKIQFESKVEKQRLEDYALYLEELLRDSGIGYTEYRMETGGDHDESLDMDTEWRLIHQRIQDAKDALDTKKIPYEEIPPYKDKR